MIIVEILFNCPGNLMTMRRIYRLSRIAYQFSTIRYITMSIPKLTIALFPICSTHSYEFSPVLYACLFLFFCFLGGCNGSSKVREVVSVSVSLSYICLGINYKLHYLFLAKLRST